MPTELKMLLATDGTVTEMLQTVADEPIAIEKLRQGQQNPDEATIGKLSLPGDRRVLRRTVVLIGSLTGRRFVFADSAIVPSRLPDSLVNDLISTETPIGTLMSRERLLTYRETLECWVQHTRTEDHSNRRDLAARQYRVETSAGAAMLINEYFIGFTLRTEQTRGGRRGD